MFKMNNTFIWVMAGIFALLLLVTYGFFYESNAISGLFVQEIEEREPVIYNEEVYEIITELTKDFHWI